MSLSGPGASCDDRYDAYEGVGVCCDDLLSATAADAPDEADQDDE
jgi:hypothetical protein